MKAGTLNDIHTGSFRTEVRFIFI